jgi:hypothetical protein
MFIDVSSLGAVEPVCDYKEKRNNPEIIALSGQSAARVDGWLGSSIAEFMIYEQCERPRSLTTD